MNQRRLKNTAKVSGGGTLHCRAPSRTPEVLVETWYPGEMYAELELLKFLTASERNYGQGL